MTRLLITAFTEEGLLYRESSQMRWLMNYWSA
jgi:hypothetical protein